MKEIASPQELRHAIRSGAHAGNTSGLAPGYVQCNIVILPAAVANDFLRFCQLNPKPCPLIAMSNGPGDFTLPPLGDVDIRTDVPSYRVFRDGEFIEECADISSLWRDDLVTFALGCSFSFEEALLADGLEVRNVSQKVNVPMYRTSIDCKPAGPFRRQNGGEYAPLQGSRRHSCDTDLHALSGCARSAGSSGRSRPHRYQRTGPAGLR